ncbi:hypothetical protein [Ruegeria sp. HKCCD8929]|uniref:hypothetical protein n=1 Tax=Ruegeria sp. HKCCD8929 TaxID=2683006 RepID=UPI001488EA4D|nr:hypothetical protein [Ruegeria sp. HKCCD8929]
MGDPARRVGADLHRTARDFGGFQSFDGPREFEQASGVVIAGETTHTGVVYREHPGCVCLGSQRIGNDARGAPGHAVDMQPVAIGKLDQRKRAVRGGKYGRIGLNGAPLCPEVAGRKAQRAEGGAQTQHLPERKPSSGDHAH